MSTLDFYSIQALNAQYTDREGYYVQEPTAFKFKDPEDGTDPYILVSIQDEECNCIMAANPPDRKVCIITIDQLHC